MMGSRQIGFMIDLNTKNILTLAPLPTFWLGVFFIGLGVITVMFGYKLVKAAWFVF